ncbi:hypothetical protein T310_7542 [Rasamsonia emersonii CBS 393.64]|uniref:Uncharacterized protein n=1 Tax=Rasamsonia emersonii (strain ATCC 16479 / CBS 393.64 / IMI 116815) TaxID=1408163 RepID=A0A0F4YK49_RASE3|nr:hypothetical protein T310_7542 [Rasamsonia emersonii CBS 393.64]KKA18505.1 hypothetical protein T310_7542 [Rasamsonia emersonii CBS 393.64]
MAKNSHELSRNASRPPHPPSRSSSKPPLTLSRSQSDPVTSAQSSGSDLPVPPLSRRNGRTGRDDDVDVDDDNDHGNGNGNDHDHDDDATSSPSSTVVPPSPASSRSPSVLSNLSSSHHHHHHHDDDDDDNRQDNDPPSSDRAALHPRVAVILGVDRKWYVPLLVCRALSVVPAAWWGLRCAFTFLAELLRIRVGMWREGWAAAIVGSSLADWDVERRFRVTEVALAIMWAPELQSPGSGDPPTRNQRPHRVSDLLGVVSIRRFVRSTTPSASLDLHHDDPHLPLPRHPKPRHDQARNHRLALRPLRRQLHQHVPPASPTASDARQRARGAGLCHGSETLGVDHGHQQYYQHVFVLVFFDININIHR